MWSRDSALFMPCTVDNQFTTLRPTKCAVLFLRYLYYNITLNVPTCLHPQGIVAWESNQSNTAQRTNNFYVQ
jgi:hypothetical protein